MTELTYTKNGDYYRPNLTYPQTEATYGKYGMMREDYLKQHKIHIHPDCVNVYKEIQQWKWQKDAKTNTYLDEPVPFFDDAMAALRYSIENMRKPSIGYNRVGGGL